MSRSKIFAGIAAASIFLAPTAMASPPAKPPSTTIKVVSQVWAYAESIDNVDPKLLFQGYEPPYSAFFVPEYVILDDSRSGMQKIPISGHIHYMYKRRVK